MNQTVLLTGATGFIGGALLHRWLSETDASLHLLVRPKRDMSPQERMDRQLDELFPGRTQQVFTTA